MDIKLAKRIQDTAAHRSPKILKRLERVKQRAKIRQKSRCNRYTTV